MSAIMGQPKPQASLSSSLLARKGQARPAMRPQGFAGFGAPAGQMDDLGWNDMGLAEPVAPPVRPVIEPAAEPMPEPPVLREREALKAEIEAPRTADPAPRPAPIERAAPKPAMTAAALTRIGRTVRAKQTKAKSAFTLRLDTDRHLRLRLAAAISDRSAQQLVTEALDAFLATLPEVEALAQSLPAKGHKTSGE